MSGKLSLKGKLVVITRSIEGSKPWIKYLKKQGAIPYSFPTIEIVPVPLTPKIKNVLKNISDFDWVVFTSAAGVRSLKKLSLARMPKIAVIGDATAKAARAAGYSVTFKPSTSSSAALAFELEPERGKSILLLRTSIASHDMRDVLTERGANVTELPIYKTVLRRDSDQKFEQLLATGRVDFITFASPSAVLGIFKRLRKMSVDQARVLPAIAIGPSVAAALRKGGFKNIRVAKEPTIKSALDNNKVLP